MERGFPLTPAMAYTPYVAIASLFVAGIAVALRNWAAATFAALAAGSPPRRGPAACRRLRRSPSTARSSPVLSVNVHLGRADVPAMMELIERRDPDLLSVQELTPALRRQARGAGICRLLPHAVLSSAVAGQRWRPLLALPAAAVARRRSPSPSACRAPS